jgi:hypothetical protein
MVTSISPARTTTGNGYCYEGYLQCEFCASGWNIRE